MKAVFYENFGNPEKVLKLKEVEKPTPKDNEVLVKIYATTVNDYEWSQVTGKPYLFRLMYGISKPKFQIPGMELAGIVEAKGKDVQSLEIGDAVFGDISDFGFGTYAEYICVDEKALIIKPNFLTFEEAAAVPHAFGLAVQALYDKGKLCSGKKVLINGGGGGVGTLGLHLAKNKDCEVTGVDTGNKLEMMKTIGFDHVIDYKECDFTQSGDKYDLIVDCKTNRFAFSYLSSLKPNGKYISIGGKTHRLLGIFLWGKIITLFSSKKLQMLGLKPNKGLDDFIDLYKQKRIKIQIDGPHQFEDIPKLLAYFGKGKHSGKIVVKTAM